MAKRYRIKQKVGTGVEILHPETEASIVDFDDSQAKLNAATVQAALEKLAKAQASAAKGGVTSINEKDGAVTLTKDDLGLGNVDNTADADKPVSTAQQTAIENAVKAVTDKLGANSGIATLDANGKVPSSQLPSYVDDYEEFTNKAAFPATGEEDKIYLAKDTNQTYRWSGSQYTVIGSDLALGETAQTAYAGSKGKKNAEDIAQLQTDVETAQTTANNAASAASDAQTAAETAQSTAEAAKTVAEAAKTAAEGADSTASGLSTKVTSIENKFTNAVTGTFTAVEVTGGIVTKGGNIIEVATQANSTPSTNLVTGGLFFELIDDSE